MKKKTTKSNWQKFWYFIWEDNSIWSWLVNVILAFILIKFIVYPILGLTLATTHPIVAVVSGSMEHNSNFEDWWSHSYTWYTNNNITKEDFSKFSLRDGFNKGDIMVLRGAKPKDIKIGDVIVFQSRRPDPIIHRVVKKWEEGGVYYFQTKGDNYNTNPDSINTPFLDETRIRETQVIGTAKLRVPLLGWIKIWFVDLVKLFVR